MNIEIRRKRQNDICFVQAEFNERVSDICYRLRLKYAIDGDFILIFNGKALRPDLTLSQNGLFNNCTLFLIEIKNAKGGEFGGSGKACDFVDPTKVSPNGIKLSSDGPFYRTVTKGINLFGICKNKKCLAYRKEVIHRFGFGSFNLNDENDDVVCPVCECLLPIDTCGFLNCKYSYIGKKFENDKIEKVEYSNVNYKTDEIDYFLKGKNNENKSKWIELKIIASKI